MPAMSSADVSPGMATMSNPTEQIAVMASSLSTLIVPDRTASIMPLSSDTGMNDPDKPPTREHAIMPPFFTASLSSANAAVVPCVPTCDNPMCSMMCATESPNSAVGARDKSTIPNGT